MVNNGLTAMTIEDWMKYEARIYRVFLYLSVSMVISVLIQARFRGRGDMPKVRPHILTFNLEC